MQFSFLWNHVACCAATLLFETGHYFHFKVDLRVISNNVIRVNRHGSYSNNYVTG